MSNPVAGVLSQSSSELRNHAQPLVQQLVSQLSPAAGNAVDGAALSDEVLDEMPQQDPAQHDNEASLMSSLRGLVQQKVQQQQPAQQQPGQQQQAAGQQGNGSGQAGGDGGQTKATWTPSVHPDEIIPGRDVIGHVHVSKEGGGASSGQGGQGGQGGSNGASAGAHGNAAAPAVGGIGRAGATAGPGATAGAGSRPAAGAAPGAPGGQQNNHANKPDPNAQQLAGNSAMMGIPQLQSALQSGQAQSGDYEVRTRATGVTQTVDVGPAGDMKSIPYFRTFQPLDDSPLLAGPTAQHMNGSDLASSLQNGNQSGDQNGPDPQSTDQLVKKLKNPAANQ
jgi:hypothetical protein